MNQRVIKKAVRAYKATRNWRHDRKGRPRNVAYSGPTVDQVLERAGIVHRENPRRYADYFQEILRRAG